MKKAILTKYKGRFWCVAELDIYSESGQKIRQYPINRHYEHDKDWFIIFDTEGGQGIGYRAGDILNKIFIGDCEFEVIEK